MFQERFQDALGLYRALLTSTPKMAVKAVSRDRTMMPRVELGSKLSTSKQSSTLAAITMDKMKAS